MRELKHSYNTKTTKKMSKRICYRLLLTQRRNSEGGVKYGLKIEKPSALGNVYGLTEEELKELRGLIDKVLTK